jgi:hypothetical protein
LPFALVLPLAEYLAYLLPYLLGLPNAYPLYRFQLGIGASPTLAPKDLSRDNSERKINNLDKIKEIKANHRI